MKSLHKWVLSLMLITVSATAALAGYPEKIIRIVNGYPPGGSADIFIRRVAAQLSVQTGVSVIVENKPGASGNIAINLVAQSAPDGYTLLIAPSSTIAGNPHIFGNLPFDVLKDLRSVATVAAGGFVLAVRGEEKADIGSLQEIWRQRNGKVAFGAGTTASRACGEVFKQAIAVSAVPAPYKSNTDALNDLAAGQTDFVCSDIGAALGFFKQKRITLLAVTTAQRVDTLPDVPTTAEIGLPNVKMEPWWGVFAPRGVSEDIVAQLSRYFREVTESKDVLAVLKAQTQYPLFSTPEETRKRLIDELASWEQLVDIGRLKQ